MADLQEKGVIADNPGAKITALEILKRQTNAEDKQDIVYVTIQAEAETAKYVRSYQVEYGLYDEGWVLKIIPNGNDIVKRQAHACRCCYITIYLRLSRQSRGSL